MLSYLGMADDSEEKQKIEILYERYRKLMYYIANQVLGDVRDSEDVVHDAFLKVIEILDKINDPESPQTKALIVTITENKAIDLYRRRRAKQMVSFEEEYTGVPKTTDIEQVEERSRLATAMAALPGKYRNVLMLKYAQGYSMEEIAGMLSMSKENVKKTIQRARKKLGDFLEREGR